MWHGPISPSGSSTSRQDFVCSPHSACDDTALNPLLITHMADMRDIASIVLLATHDAIPSCTAFLAHIEGSFLTVVCTDKSNGEKSELTFRYVDDAPAQLQALSTSQATKLVRNLIGVAMHGGTNIVVLSRNDLEPLEL